MRIWKKYDLGTFMNVNVTSRKHFLLLSDDLGSCAENRLLTLANYVTATALDSSGIQRATGHPHSTAKQLFHRS